MKYLNFINKITQYLDGELSLKDGQEFEDAMNNNKEYKDVFLDIKNNDLSLKKLPKINTPPSFIVELNQRIDDYESAKKISIYTKYIEPLLNVFNNKEGSKLAPLSGMVAILLITTFSIFKVSQYSESYEISDNNFDLNNSIAINESDSLNSIEEEPVLLIGNGR